MDDKVVDDFMRSIFEAQTKCNYPSYVFWLSKKKAEHESL